MSIGIYTNATRKLAEIKQREIDGTQNVWFADGIGSNKNIKFKIKKYTKPVSEKIGIFEDITIGLNHRCYYCERQGYTNKDHFYPKSKGGILIVRSCTSCNSHKADFLPNIWIHIVKYEDSFSESKKDRIIKNTRKLINQIKSDELKGFELLNSKLDTFSQ